MTTPEQQARVRAYERLAQNQCHGTAIQGRTNEPEQELANLIAERDALKAELDAIKGAGEPVAWSVTMGGAHTGNVCGEQREAINLMNRLNQSFPDDKRAVVPLYTRPCVPLTDEKVKELICEHFVTGENLFNEVHQDYRFRSRATERNVWGRDLLAFARDVEAHIKGAK